jgi:hypothetical protein
MQYINIKNFQKDFFKVVKDLPVTITKYGVPMYVLTKVDTDVAPKFSKKISNNNPAIKLAEAANAGADFIRKNYASVPVTTAEIEDVGPVTFRLCKTKFCNNSAEEGSDFCKEHK